MKCYVCDKRIRKSQAYLGEEGTSLESKPLCEDCYYEDAQITLFCLLIFEGAIFLSKMLSFSPEKVEIQKIE